MTDFQNLLSKPVTDIERPPPLPAGSYFFTIQRYSMEKIGQKQTPACTLVLTVNSPDEVDPDEIDAIGGLAKIQGRQMRYNFFVTEDALWRFREFIEKVCHINTSGRTLGECIPEILNVQVRGIVEPGMTRDGEPISNITKLLEA